MSCGQASIEQTSSWLGTGPTGDCCKRGCKYIAWEEAMPLVSSLNALDSTTATKVPDISSAFGAAYFPRRRINNAGVQSAGNEREPERTDKGPQFRPVIPDKPSPCQGRWTFTIC